MGVISAIASGSGMCALVFGHQQGDGLATVAAVKAEVRIEGEYFCPSVQLGQPHQAGIGERHRPVAIAAHQRPEVGPRLFQLKGHADNLPLQQRKDGARIHPRALQNERRLGQPPARLGAPALLV